VTFRSDGPDSESQARELACRALAEDGPNDITSDIVAARGVVGTGVLESRNGGVFAGLKYAAAVLAECNLVAEWEVSEGAAVSRKRTIGTVTGDLADILRAERPMLNLLQRACGIATATRSYVVAVEGTGCRILHTRKTAPGLRQLDIDSVLAGGGQQHRLGLHDAVLVKDNHWHVLSEHRRDLGVALADARSQGVAGLYVEVETLDQVDSACAAGATRLLIDNQPPETVAEWGAIARDLSPGIEIEASGGITLDNVRSYAEAGVDYASVGALTHSVVAADLALEIREGE
jgi:nicotinate-nucleotide pyrophosphorylase (carboxylating)